MERGEEVYSYFADIYVCSRCNHAEHYQCYSTNYIPTCRKCNGHMDAVEGEIVYFKREE